jgi:hypothetical protein
MSEQYDKLLEEQTKEKGKAPTFKASKTFRYNWDDWLVRLFKKLFNKEATHDNF